MVLDDVTFARVVVEGKVGTVTITVIGPIMFGRNAGNVTRENARVGLRVMRGPDWNDSKETMAGPASAARSLTDVPMATSGSWIGILAYMASIAPVSIMMDGPITNWRSPPRATPSPGRVLANRPCPLNTWARAW
jgi:hypothetical protein